MILQNTRIAFFTLGCKVNQYETAALQKLFENAGYEIVDVDEKAEVYVINSCTVTSEGDRKSRRMLRRVKRVNPDAVACLCGCFPQAFPDIAAAIPEADIIMGSKNRSGLLKAVESALKDGNRIIDIPPHKKNDGFEDIGVKGLGKFYPRTRAFLKIEDGCDRYCSYCVIPSARGAVRSKPLSAIREELETLAESGYAEVVLAGVNLSRYGQDLGLRLIDAVKLACSSGIKRVRLSSLEPELLTVDDVAEMSKLEKLCPHFHLSLQSGCDDTLKRMNRHYDTAGYSRIVESIRASFENCAITTDIMVGFPGETDSEFLSSLKFCEDTGFAKAHVFAYSKRAGTRAAVMPDQVPDQVKRDRSEKMISALNASRNAFLESQLNASARVLFETRRADGFWEGHSENYTPVLKYSDDDLKNMIIEVTPDYIEGEYCISL